MAGELADTCIEDPDELFARDVFKRAVEKQKYLIENHSSVDFSSDEKFLQFWTENGQYLCWYLFSKSYPEYPNDIFENLPTLSPLDGENLNKKWIEISNKTFAYAQLYWAAIH